ncbi:MAG: hypothetical protein ACO1OB_30035 [Archangium sp.]
MPRLLLALVLVPAFAHAQALVAAVVDATNVSDANVRRVQRATENALKQVSSLAVGEGPSFKKGAPRRCSDDCAQQLVSSLNAAGVVVLELRALDKTGEKLAVEAQLWLDGEKVGAKRGEGTVDGFDVAVRPALEALLPAWARKGFGGLRLQVEPGTVVKVDGRVATARAGEVVAVPAGVHQVDVVFPEGHAVLQRLEVGEGSRVKVEAQSPEEAVSGKAPKRMSALRAVSYGTFVAGAAVLAGGLIAGAVGRGTAAGLSSCSGDVRDCATLVEVQRRQAESESYATTGNVLVGVGSGLAATGVALFIIDAVTD